jgi:hypothetical protein
MHKSSRSLLGLAALVFALVMASAAPLLAQRFPSQARDGMTRRQFWGALSLGNATAALSCSVCRDMSDRSVAAGLTLGVRQSSRMYLGVQLDGWYRFSGGENDRVYSIGPLVQYYPNGKRPLFVRLGLGWAAFLATDEDENVSSRSVAAQVGVGYDVAISHSYLLTPFVSYMRGAGGRLSVNGDNATIPAGVELLQYGLQMTLR